MNISLNDLECLTYGLKLRAEEDIRQENMGDLAYTALTTFHLIVEIQKEMDKYDCGSSEYRRLTIELEYCKSILDTCETFDIVHATIDVERRLLA